MSPSIPAPVLIRVAQREDIGKLTSLQVDSIRTLGDQHYNAKQLQALINNKKQGRGYKEIIFVAEIDSQIVGFAALSLNSPTINGIFVNPTFIRQGIGTKLLAALENEAVRMRDRVLTVSAALNAVEFYQARGYKIIGKNNIYLGVLPWVPIPVAVMKKVLIPPSKKEIIAIWLMWILLILFLVLAIVLPLLSGR